MESVTKIAVLFMMIKQEKKTGTDLQAWLGSAAGRERPPAVEQAWLGGLVEGGLDVADELVGGDGAVGGDGVGRD
eukprot:3014159-Rhodomonas_salina.1